MDETSKGTVAYDKFNPHNKAGIFVFKVTDNFEKGLLNFGPYPKYLTFESLKNLPNGLHKDFKFQSAQPMILKEGETLRKIALMGHVPKEGNTWELVLVVVGYSLIENASSELEINYEILTQKTLTLGKEQQKSLPVAGDIQNAV